MIYTDLTKKAMRVAYKAHHGQTDISGVPYIFHPIHVAEQMKDELTTCVALLHDVVEDTDITLDDLAREFPQDVVDGVDYMTHREDVPYEDYIRRLKSNAAAVAVKRADIENNMDVTRYRPDTPSDEVCRRQKKYKSALDILNQPNT